MLISTTWIAKNYSKFNKKYWNNELPTIKFKVGRSAKTWGYAGYVYKYNLKKIVPEFICISNYYDSPESVKLTTLLHEMVHIAEYTFYPERFRNNAGKKLRYDAHGWWFQEEARRLAKDGWDIQKYVTINEIESSTVNSTVKKRLDEKTKNALVAVVKGNNGYNYVFRTSKQNVESFINVLNNYYWERTLAGIKDIQFFSFKDDEMAAMRESNRRLSGYYFNSSKLEEKLKKINAKQNNDYNRYVVKYLGS